ncbi:MAG: hypothetical protein WBW58_13665 [Candidatus Acidiferrum sp.]
MSVKNWLAASALLPGLCLVALPASARQPQQQEQQTTAQQGTTQQGTTQQQASDPLAEAARKAREQQKNAPKPKKVYTDDDIKPRTDSTPAAAATDQNGSAPAAADNGQGDAASGASKGADPETMWRKRFADQRDKIATAEKELDILQREDDKAQVQYYSDPQKALMQQNTRQDINDKDAKIAQKKQEIENLKQQLSDMEDELRKSGGDPGWARE